MSTIHRHIDNLPVAQDTKFLLKELVKRKNKMDRLKFLLGALSVLDVVLGGAALLWLFKMSVIANSSSFGLFGYLGGSQAAVMFLIVLASIFIYSGNVGKEYRKQKQKYKDLQREAVSRIEAKWDVTNESMLRDEISDLLYNYNKTNIRYWN